MLRIENTRGELIVQLPKAPENWVPPPVGSQMRLTYPVQDKPLMSISLRGLIVASHVVMSPDKFELKIILSDQYLKFVTATFPNDIVSVATVVTT